MKIFTFTKFGRALLLTAVLVVGAVWLLGCGGKTDTQAEHWKKEAAQNEWGDVVGYGYTQTVRSEGKSDDGEADKWALAITYLGGNKIAIIIGEGEEYPAPPFMAVEKGKLSVSLRDESGNTQDFIGTYSPAGSGTASLTILCPDINLVQALEKNAKYTLLVSKKSKYDNWYVRAEINGGLPTDLNASDAQKNTDAAPARQKVTESAQSSAPAPTENAKSPAALVPTGYKILQEVKGDLNKDGLEDYAFVIAGKQDESRRGIVIAFNNDDKYENVLESRNIFSYNKDEVSYAPDVEVAIKKGVLGIEWSERFGGGASYRQCSYKFRFQNSDFELIGYDASNNGGLGTRSAVSINVLSNKMQTKENKAEDGSSKEFNETWNDIVIKEPIKLRKIGELGEFNVMKNITVR